jgi:cohesin complex subunit SA-1/2
LEAVKSLLSLYNKEDYLITLQHFTERFKPRLIAMATNDTELSVRVAVIQVLGAIDSNSLLEEDQRETLCLLLFDQEPRVRKAVAGFVHGVWEESVNQRLVGRRGAKEHEKGLAGAKALATLLVNWDAALTKRGGAEEEESQSQAAAVVFASERHTQEIAVLGNSQKSRMTLAVEALWDEVDAVRDWEVLLGLLLLDHSAGATDGAGPSGAVSKLRKKQKILNTPRKGKAPSNIGDDDAVDEAWRLEEHEETILVEVLLACLRKTLADASTKKGVCFFCDVLHARPLTNLIISQGDAEGLQAQMTRDLIKALPKLFAKHQTDLSRISEILLIPQLMNLELYLEMRMITVSP